MRARINSSIRWSACIALAIVASQLSPPASQSKPAETVGSMTTVIYEEAKDRSSVGFSDFEITSATGCKVFLSVGCGYDGREPVLPKQCFVGLTVRIDRQTYSLNHDTPYSIIADGNMVVDAVLKNYGVERDGDAWLEPLITLWTWDQLRALASAGDITIKLPDRAMPLDSTMTTSLRDIVAHFE